MVIIGKYNKSVILTYIGGIFALFGMIFAIIDNLQYSLICLMLAGICDLFDGKIARMCKRTDIEKEFGKQIDSLVDVFSFVALPCVIAIKLFLNINIWLCIIMIFYLLSGIIRLAWFNIISSKEEAVKLGAEAQFIERYGDRVTVYQIGDVSLEICGGPHVSNTSELGHFKIKKEESSSAGVRRIKAVLTSE